MKRSKEDKGGQLDTNAPGADVTSSGAIALVVARLASGRLWRADGGDASLAVGPALVVG